MKKTGMLRLAALAVCLWTALAALPVRALTRVLEVRTGDLGATLRSSPEYLGDKNKIRGIHPDTVLHVLDASDGWYYVQYDGYYGYVIAAEPYTYVVKAEQLNDPDFQEAEEYDMGIPLLGGRVVGQDEMNLTVFWVQTQLRASGGKYWEDKMDVTGLLDKKTMEKIAAFMRDRGFEGHAGRIDQDVVDELAYALGRKLQPVPVGGKYRAMNAIIGTGSTGNMRLISAATQEARYDEAVRWVQLCLGFLGYYPGEADGRYGAETDAAVRAFERDHGFLETDSVSLGVARAMLESYAAAGGDPDLLP